MGNDVLNNAFSSTNIPIKPVQPVNSYSMVNNTNSIVSDFLNKHNLNKNNLSNNNKDDNQLTDGINKNISTNEFNNGVIKNKIGDSTFITIKDPQKILNINKNDQKYYTTDAEGNKIFNQDAYKQDVVNSLKDSGVSDKNISIGDNGEIHLTQTDGMDWMDAGKLALGTAQVGLGFANYNLQKGLVSKQKDLLDEQLNEAREEYSRVKDARKRLSSSY